MPKVLACQRRGRIESGMKLEKRDLFTIVAIRVPVTHVLVLITDKEMNFHSVIIMRISFEIEDSSRLKLATMDTYLDAGTGYSQGR